MESQPDVLSLDPNTFGEVLGDRADPRRGHRPARDAGVAVIQDAAVARLDRVRLAVRDAERPRVVALEWMNPAYIAGHWTPQLIEYAGGEDVLGMAGEPVPSARSWEEVAAAGA